MVTLLLDSAQLEVVLSATERAAAFRQRNVLVSRENIARVQLTDDAWSWLRGVPRPGLLVPAVIAAGSFESAGGTDFVLVRRRRPSVVVDLERDDEFQRLILTTRHGVALVRALRLEVENEPADVADLVDQATSRRHDTA